MLVSESLAFWYRLGACGESVPVKLSGRKIGECESPQ
jgi:hypothetical protein